MYAYVHILLFFSGKLVTKYGKLTTSIVERDEVSISITLKIFEWIFGNLVDLDASKMRCGMRISSFAKISRNKSRNEIR